MFNHAKLGLVLGAALLLAAPSAFAGAGVIKTDVQSLSGDVTYSRVASGSNPALDTYIGYSVAISNEGGNTINNIRFTATTRVTDTAEKATFYSAEGALCAAVRNPLTAMNPGINDGTSIECAIGQLTAGKAFPKFAIFFKAPVKVGDNGLGDNSGSDKVTISGITYYAEGTGGPNSVPDNSTNEWPELPIEVTLGTCNPDRVKSALPKSGGTFFTGGAESCASDPFAVSVKVPQYTTYSTVELDESDVSSNINCSSLGNFFKCFSAKVDIPNVVFAETSGKYLTIVLRTLASNIKPGAKISSVLIQYDDGISPNRFLVPQCSGPTTPLTGTDAGKPCIAKAVYYKNKSVPGWTPELDGAFEWTLINLRNGSFDLF